MIGHALRAGLPPASGLLALASSETRNDDMTGVYLNYLWVSLAVFAVLVGLGWLGWRNRKRRQSHVPAPPAIPAELLEREPLAAAEGMVIGTVTASHYLDRVAVHGLGIRTDGLLEVHPEGVAVLRSGAGNFLIPRERLNGLRTDRGVVGKFVEADGALIIGWRLGEDDVETAFRARSAEAHQQLIDDITKMAGLDAGQSQNEEQQSP